MVVETVEDTLARDPGEDRRRHAELEEDELSSRVRIGADRHPGPRRRDRPKALDVEVLPVGICVDLERGARRRGGAGDALPVRGETDPKVIDATARMCEDLDVGVGKRFEVPIGLIVL